MSIKIMQEVWEHAPVSGGTLLVLLAIADSADERSRTCFPGIESLAHKARLSDRQVKRVLAELADLKIIHVDRNASPFKTNLYRVADPSNWFRSDILSPTGKEAEVTSATCRWDAHVPSDGTPMSPKPSVTEEEPSDIAREQSSLFSAIEEPESQADRSESAKKKKEDRFEELWQSYPKAGRKDKQDARKRYVRIVNSGVGPDELIAAALAYSKWLDSGGPRDFRPNPKNLSTWLNKKSWEDEIPEPAPPPSQTLERWYEDQIER